MASDSESESEPDWSPLDENLDPLLFDDGLPTPFERYYNMNGLYLLCENKAREATEVWILFRSTFPHLKRDWYDNNWVFNQEAFTIEAMRSAVAHHLAAQQQTMI